MRRRLCGLGMKGWLIVGCLALSGGAAAQGKKTCSWQVAPGSAKLQWTGYKFHDKFAVNGTFDLIDFDQNAKSPDVATLMKSIQFRIETHSLNTGVPDRDKKLVLFVFAGTQNPGWITGSVTHYDGKSAKAKLSLNGKTREVPFTVARQGDDLTLTGKTDLLDFAMGPQHKALSEACKLLHTGGDGKPKTWSEVGLQVTAKVQSVCQ